MLFFSTSDVYKSAVIVTADNILTIAFGRRLFETGYTEIPVHLIYVVATGGNFFEIIN